MNLLRKGYSLYSFFVFVFLFLLLFPGFILVIQREKWHKYAFYLNRIWARAFFFLSFIKIEKDIREHLSKKEQYVFTPNHFSYLDIVMMGFLPVNFVFVGKISLARIPLFGYMYRKLHIVVDRERLRSSYNTVILGKKAVEQGKSLVIFPEGGIMSKNPPKMVKFKDGPFRIAIEKQIPVVPVTIPYNWIFLPDDSVFIQKFCKLKLVVHEAIPTTGMDMDDLETLKEKTYKIIDQELKKTNKFQSL